MKHHLLQVLVQTRRQGLTKGRVRRKVETNLQHLQSLRCLKGALHTTTRTSLCVLPFSMESASSKELQGNVVHGATTSAIRRDVIVQSHTIFAHTQTDYRLQLQQFHMVHLLSLLNFLQGRELFRKQPYKQGCELSVLTMKWFNRLHP